ncbi:cyclophilin-like domain-containing protein [Mycena albidolilacea]|uniref:Peptidyl-prolyl cis-trans isomerase n=1 Tax=Mycena albidolilacea TaxID=1033008 RepID=A0AAD7AMU2_9AGAR|nr:cyclophilin-like domain-containing protein [Mycena albidolilacea]
MSSTRSIVFMDINIREMPAGRLKMELFVDIVPKAAENLRQLCTYISTSEYRVNSQLQGYKNAMFHRVPDFMCQGTDFLKADSTGSFSIYGDKFLLAPSLKFFFVMTAKCEFLDGKHVIFGKVIDGMLTLRKIEAVQTGLNNQPKLVVKITECGEM